MQPLARLIYNLALDGGIPMTENSIKSRFAFSRLLSASEQEFLQETGNWRWVASIGAEDIAPAIRHMKHQRWINAKGNVHRPAMREIMFCLRGDSVFGFHGQVHRLLPGTVFLFDHYEGRDLISAPYQKDYGTLWLHFDKRESFRYNTFALDATGRPYREISTRIKAGDSGCLIMDAWDHCKETPSDRLCWTLLKAALTTTLLEILGTARQQPLPSPQQEVIASVQEYIRNHPMDDLSLRNLSRIAGYSSFFFHRLFVQYAGQTPRSYVNHVRLDRAKALLRQNYTLEAVAGMIGMRHPSYFSRFFKEHMGCPPGNWRKRIQA